MHTLTLASGREIPCDGATAGQQYSDYLHIHTAALGFVEAAQLFSDPAQTETIKYEESEELYVFRGFTTLLGISADPLIRRPGELLIRLQRPEKEAQA